MILISIAFDAEGKRARILRVANLDVDAKSRRTNLCFKGVSPSSDGVDHRFFEWALGAESSAAEVDCKRCLPPFCVVEVSAQMFDALVR